MPVEVLEFVDSISASATVRLTLTTDPWRVLFDGTSFPPPPIARSIQKSSTQDGAFIRSSTYDNREIILRLMLKHASTTTAATQLQLLNRELDRPSNFLRYQPDANIPAVYFRTYRSADYQQQHDHGLNLYNFTLTIPADSFAYGLPVNAGPFAVSNNPAAGSLGKFFDLTSIQGDVETPIQMKFTGSEVSGRSAVIAVRRRGTPSLMPLFIQAEALTMGTDTTTQANNAAFSGTGNNFTQTTFVTSTLVQRLSSSFFPGTANSNARGTYRVFARLSGSTGSTTYNVQLKHGARVISNKVVPLVNVFTNATCVDLGLIQLPEGFDPQANGPSGQEFVVAGVPFSLWAQRVSGSGQLIVDYFIFMPADDRLSFISWGGSSPTTFVYDGYVKGIYGLDGFGQITDIQNAYFKGDVPMIYPGVTNRICYINDVTTNPPVSDGVASTVTINVTYWPRYLYVRPVST